MECLTFLQSKLHGEKSHSVASEILRTQGYIFLRLACFLRDAGYHELSLALWQAVLDFTLPIGTRDSLPKDQAIAKFQEYWDSEVSRMGEDGYNSWSWRQTLSDQRAPMPPKTVSRQPVNWRLHFWKHYTNYEFENAEKDILKTAGRTEDEVLENDPFHIVLFTDLAPILEAMAFPFESVEFLIAGFLCYCGLPPAVDETMNSSLASWWKDSFVQTWPLNVWDSLGTLEESFPSYLAIRVMTQDALFGEPLQCRAQDPGTIFISNTLQFLMRRLHLAFSGTHPLETVIAEYFIAYQLSHMPSK
jgi:hypothetical protein